VARSRSSSSASRRRRSSARSTCRSSVASSPSTRRRSVSRRPAGTDPIRRTANAAVSSAAMCEHFVARSDQRFRIDTLWPFTERLERFGIAGFGWGAAWRRLDGRLDSYRNLLAFRDDPGREAVGRNETTSLLVHLRRPSKLSTLTLPDTQPFAD